MNTSTTPQSRKDLDMLESYVLGKRSTVLTSGRSVGAKIATGRVRVIKSAEFIGQFQQGEVLVTDKTDPDWQPIMKKAAGITQLADAAAKAEIGKLTAGYTDKPQCFVDKLAQGVAMIAAAFYPKDVILRLSDFKTHEYANLIGGKAYEPAEENPVLGFRGASERNAAVKKMIAQVIATCRAKGRKIGICGQAPGDYPEFAQFLVEQGIDSISLTPDTVLKTTLAVLEKEAQCDKF